MKRRFKGFVLITALSAVLAACGNGDSNQEDKNMDGMDHGNMDHMDDEEGGNRSGVSEEKLIEYAMPPEKMNEYAQGNRLTVNTKNTTRLDTQDPIDASILISQIVWPATHEENQPGAVILVPNNNWQVGLAAADLIHNPTDGPVLLTEKDKLSAKTLNEIKRLNPKGTSDGTQVMVMGGIYENVAKQLNGYKVEAIDGTEPAQFAAAVDQKYAEISGGEFPKGVIIVSAEEEAKAYSLPAINWISHMPEPILYVTKDGIPDITKQALQEREEANMYILGPESIVSKEIEKELADYGNVTRIAGEDPVSNSVEFAKFRDEDNAFGWGLTDSGHGISFISTATPELAIAAAPFSHRGKHAPLIWLENGQVTEPVYNFLASIKPTFKEDPTAGPYNHGFIISGQESIPFETQGIIDDKLEIVQEDGEGHGGH
ncbi:cell wall-binding repeat-containing protein [Domibacillus epiphyticus]|uniref:ArsR family transcriptional regulator n=1 Tax=Domibacillus epiphyticus TaxID=1714355 RepID=A0A1V2ABU6_9BACI|nr:ArsR family transcriptional regulator [Domibacillus epiphyticus]OMP68312.1 ArsR family transcriptional regulator [Domibacillus epiphyticus]